MPTIDHIEKGGDFGGTWYWNRYRAGMAGPPAHRDGPVDVIAGLHPRPLQQRGSGRWRGTGPRCTRFGLGGRRRCGSSCGSGWS